MEEGRPSTTAVGAATLRAAHQVLDDPPIIADPIALRLADAETAAQTWYARHHVVPINHMVVVTEKLAKSSPQTVEDIYRLLLQAKTAAGLPKAGAIDFLAFGLTVCRPALQTIITYALQQRLIPRKLEVDELFDDTTRALERLSERRRKFTRLPQPA